VKRERERQEYENLQRRSPVLHPAPTTLVRSVKQKGSSCKTKKNSGQDILSLEMMANRAAEEKTARKKLIAKCGVEKNTEEGVGTGELRADPAKKRKNKTSSALAKSLGPIARI